MKNNLKLYMLSTVTALFLFGIAAFFIVNAILGADIDSPNEDILTGKTEQFEIPEAFANVSAESFNMLFIHTDVSHEKIALQKDGELSLDCAVLVRVDKERGQITNTFIPLNTLVTFGGSKVSLFDVYNARGIDFMCDKVYALTGITVDHYAIITDKFIEKTVEYLGGITFTVTSKLSCPDYDDKSRTVDIPAGTQMLGGKEAALVLRYSNVNIAEEREKMLFSFIKVMASSLFNPQNRESVSQLYDTLAEYCITDFSKDVFEKKSELLFMYQSFTVETLKLCGEYRIIGDEKYFVCDTEKTLALFYDYRKIYF